MDTEFLHWTELTDAYARRLLDAARGDRSAFDDLRHLATDIRKQDSGFAPLEDPIPWPIPQRQAGSAAVQRRA